MHSGWICPHLNSGYAPEHYRAEVTKEISKKPADKKGSVNEFLGKVGAGDRAYFSTTNYYMNWPRAPPPAFALRGKGDKKD